MWAVFHLTRLSSFSQQRVTRDTRNSTNETDEKERGAAAQRRVALTPHGDGAGDDARRIGTAAIGRGGTTHSEPVEGHPFHRLFP